MNTSVAFQAMHAKSRGHLHREMIRVRKAAGNSCRGLLAAYRSEAAVRLEVAAALALLPIAFLLAPTSAGFLALVASLILVLIVEMLNTAIEKVCDRITLEHDRQIGAIKDMASGAVLLSLGVCGLAFGSQIAARF